MTLTIFQFIIIIISSFTFGILIGFMIHYRYMIKHLEDDQKYHKERLDALEEDSNMLRNIVLRKELNNDVKTEISKHTEN